MPIPPIFWEDPEGKGRRASAMNGILINEDGLQLVFLREVLERDEYPDPERILSVFAMQAGIDPRVNSEIIQNMARDLFGDLGVWPENSSLVVIPVPNGHIQHNDMIGVSLNEGSISYSAQTLEGDSWQERSDWWFIKDGEGQLNGVVLARGIGGDIEGFLGLYGVIKIGDVRIYPYEGPLAFVRQPMVDGRLLNIDGTYHRVKVFRFLTDAVILLPSNESQIIKNGDLVYYDTMTNQLLGVNLEVG